MDKVQLENSKEVGNSEIRTRKLYKFYVYKLEKVELENCNGFYVHEVENSKILNKTYRGKANQYMTF